MSTKNDNDIKKAAFDELYKKGFDTIIKKGADYANDTNGFANFEKVAHMLDMDTRKVFLFYITTKLVRLSELFEGNTKPKNESVEDTIMDFVNYAVLLKAWLMKQSKSE